MEAFESSDYINFVTSLTSSPSSTENAHDVNHGLLVLFTIFMAFITIAMAVGNLFVIVAVVAVRPLRSASDQLIINLCVSGAILGLIVMPYGTMTTFLRVPVGGEGMCIAMAYIKMIAMFSTNLTLTAIGVDRYMKVKHTSLHRLRFKRPLVIIVLIWLLSILCAMPPLVGWGWYRWLYNKPICTNDWISSVSYTLFLVIFLVSLPLCVVFYCYGSIVRAVVQSRRRLDVHQQNTDAKDSPPPTECVVESLDAKSHQVEDNPERWADRTDKPHNMLTVSVVIDTQLPRTDTLALDGLKTQTLDRTPYRNPKPTKQVNRADIAVLRTMIIVVSTYVIFWYPYIICMLIKITTKERMSFVVEAVTIELAFLGMAINPFTYAFSNKRFRRDLKLAFTNIAKNNHPS